MSRYRRDGGSNAGNQDSDASDKDKPKKVVEKKKKKPPASSGSSSDSSSSSHSSSDSSSSGSSSGSSSRSSSSSSSSTSSSNSGRPKRKKTTAGPRAASPSRARPTARAMEAKKPKAGLSKEKDDKKLKPKMARSVSPRRPMRKERSPTPRPTKIHIGRLSRNISREHILEIFSTFGTVKLVDFPTDRYHPNLGKGFAYAEFETADEAENAMKHMDGGQIDGQEITAAPVLVPKPRPPPIRRLSPLPMRRPMPRWGNNNFPRYRQQPRFRSPPPRRRPRTRSPPRKRRHSRSSSSGSR